MRALRFLLSVAFAVLFPTIASAAERREPPNCDAKNSQPISFAGAHSDDTDLFGECVAIRGFRIADAIFQDQPALYRFSSKHRRDDRTVVGISPDDWDAPMEEGTAFGRLRNCVDVQEAHARAMRSILESDRRSGTITLVEPAGFCSRNDGVAVDIDHWTPLAPIRWSRVTDGSQRETLGDLQPIPPNFQYSKVVEWLVRNATEGVCDSALRTGNAPIAAPFDRSAPSPSEDGKWVAAIKKTCGAGRPKVATFLVSPQSTQAKREAKLDVVMCVSTRNTSERWPIATIDIGWEVDRPYVCERATLTPNHCWGGECTSPTWEYEFMDEYLVSYLWRRHGFREPN
jgi:hypothetical protein